MQFDPKRNYEESRGKAGYISLKDATQKDYDRIGFMSGLEVHQQLLTKEKLFCHCPAGIYNGHDDYDAELIRRKQYLDGSIPTGFQRTAILGVEGEIELPYKKIRLIQLSIEEDSCREISDIGHTRVYKTDRLGMPLIETVTYPDCLNPYEVKDACDYIRFLNRSTGKVRTGMGAGRQDVNVSCRGGSRVEIKGVAHTKWIPKLTHNEAFRQWSLLLLRDELKERIKKPDKWKINSVELEKHVLKGVMLPGHAEKLVAVNLPDFKGALSWFTQPGKMFADELSGRLKVIACIEHPNMLHSEEFEPSVNGKQWKEIRELLDARDNDAQIIITGPAEDIPTALETVEERCRMALEGIPNETRKSFEDGTTVFERVLPGADRMYPDTDSAPIPLEDEFIESLKKNLPEDIIDRYKKMKAWGIPDDTYIYILSKNHFDLISRIIEELDIDPKFVGTFFGHTLKSVENKICCTHDFKYSILYHLFAFLKKENLDFTLAEDMLPVLMQNAKMDFESILNSIKFKRVSPETILEQIPVLNEKFANGHKKGGETNRRNWVMGQLRSVAIGNMSLTELSERI